MNETRIVKLVKQLGAADGRRSLAMKHLKTALAGNQDNPMDFLARGVDYLLCVSKITKPIAQGLNNSIKNNAYTESGIEQLDQAIRQSGSSWEAIARSAEACPPSPKAPINYAPAKPSVKKSVRANDSAIYNEINSKGLNIKQRAAIAEAADRLMRNDARTRGNVEPKMRSRISRSNMPEIIIGIPEVVYKGKTRTGEKLVRLRIESTEFILMTEVIAIGRDVRKIALNVTGNPMSFKVTIPQNPNKYPVVNIL